MKYTYPAIFEKEETAYNVTFPDIPHCFTCGEHLTEALEMAKDALALTLYHSYESKGITPPTASDICSIQYPQEGFVNYIACDTLDYRKRFCNKAVKKTLSIPEWLNEEALNANINFSQVLQDSLKEKLGVA